MSMALVTGQCLPVPIYLRRTGHFRDDHDDFVIVQPSRVTVVEPSKEHLIQAMLLGDVVVCPADGVQG